MDPNQLNKYLYIEKTPTWLIRTMYLLALLFWLPVAYGFYRGIGADFVFTYIAPIFIGYFTIYHVVSFTLNLFYRQFDLQAHEYLKNNYWANQDNHNYKIDVFLPICGESLEVLNNTWQHVAKLDYEHLTVYVLDDSKEEVTEHKKLAEQYGFIHLQRPNRGWMKKAGNLRYGYERSHGDFIVIFDADFAPRRDFIRELLPHMSDPKNAIIQSPQFFNATKELHQRSPLEYGAAQTQEAFYRFIQVSRDRFGAPICCGSNAIYRRAALAEIGGTALIEHSEDAHTGFALTKKGWRVKYVPLILALGLCPDNAHAYFHQQHRWCFGSLSLLGTKEFWQAKIPWTIKWCYTVGLLFYLHHPFAILFSFQIFWSLFMYNANVSLASSIIYLPSMIWGFVYMLAFPIQRFRWGCFYATFVQLYSYSHAVISSLLKGAVGWIPTNSKQIDVSSAFKQTTWAIGIYVFVYIALIARGFRDGLFHLDYNYLSIQFWVVYNLVLSVSLLILLYRTIDEIKVDKVISGQAPARHLTLWRLKVAGGYTALLVASFFVILLIK